MAVSNYLAKTEYGCRYNYSKLKNRVYLVSEDHTKKIFIDNGEAYVSGLTDAIFTLDGFNIEFNEETSLDERYKFQKSLTISINGVPEFIMNRWHDVTGEYICVGGDKYSKQQLQEWDIDIYKKYYLIIETTDGTFYIINVDFPSKITHTYNLSKGINRTDFTFSSLSNFPSLKLNNFNPTNYEICKSYHMEEPDGLKMIESTKTVCNNQSVYASTSFKNVEYLGDSLSFQESFDGNRFTTTVEFQIAFDAYKSSWHYNLLEFVLNRYAAIIGIKNSPDKVYSGFNNGLQPNYTIKSSSEKGQSDIVTITLTEMSENGLKFGDYSINQNLSNHWRYIKNIGNRKSYECIGNGAAIYLLQEECDYFGNPTGNYKALNGYESLFPELNIIGTFEFDFSTGTFVSPDCYNANCVFMSDLPNTINFNAETCYTYSLLSTGDWNITNIPSWITVSPTSGNANANYTITVCNTTSSCDYYEGYFAVNSCDNQLLVNVKKENCTPEYRWVDMNIKTDYYCVDIDKYYKQKKQVSYNSGTTWEDVTPAEYQLGDFYEKASLNCGCEYVRVDLTFNTPEDNTHTQLINCYGYNCTDLPNMVIDGVRVGTSTPAYPYVFSSAGIHNVTMYVHYQKFLHNGVELGLFSGLTYLTSAHIYDCAKWTSDYIFANSKQLTDVIFSKNIVTQGVAALEGCTSLTGVTFSEDMCNISQRMFKNCTSLETITIPDNITVIGPYAFIDCSGLTSCTIGSGVTRINTDAFRRCINLQNLTIGNSVTIIDVGAFLDCSGLTSVTIPDSVTSIGQDSFQRCSGLTSVNIGSGVTSIGVGAFSGCNSLTYINIPDSVTSIGGSAFADCTSLPVENYIRYADTYLVGQTDYTLNSYSIKNSTRWIGNNAFAGCTNITSITIPDGVIEIGSGAFNNCTRLTGITIPSGVTAVGSMAFFNCPSLPVENYIRYADTYLVEVVDKTMNSYSIKNSTRWIGNKAFAGCANITSITIPNNVLDIQGYAFSGCSNLTDIVIPNSVASIGNYAFYNCYSLSSCTIGSGVTYIGEYAFQYCTRLTDTNIPDSVETIGGAAFCYCSGLTSVVIPSGVTSIGSSAFRSCSSLASITVNATTPPTLSLYTFNDTNNCPIYVPAESLNIYKGASGWSSYASRIQAIP